jgi:peroxiredoxin
MRLLFGVTYALLCGLVILEALVLRQVLRDTVSLKRFYSEGIGTVVPEGLFGGTSAPEFSAPGLDGEILRVSDFEGYSTILLFLSPQDTASVCRGDLSAVIHALWHRVQGHIYLVCSGEEESCRQSARGKCMVPIRIALDIGGEIARSFKITSTPRAVEFDSQGRVVRYGHPENLEAGSETTHRVSVDAA